MNIPRSVRAYHPIRKFNPGTFQSDDEVIRQFVVRRRELDIVLEVLRENIDSPSCQHALLVAPRGQGKTMMLARIVAEICTAPSLSSHLFPVQFMEESQEVFDIADFWLETLFHLAKGIEASQEYPDLARELQETHADLAARWQEKHIVEYIRNAVLQAADRIGRRLVLMVENLQALCDKQVDEDFGWQLRKTLQTEPRIILLGTATYRFKGLDDVSHPFFEMFRIVNLEPLRTQDCQRLWQIVSGDERVTEREIRPLQILAGGNPRLLVAVADLARHRPLDILMENLLILVDQHTEYLRNYLTAITSNSERHVYLAVLDLWQPSTTAEITMRVRMDIRVVSVLLGRLVSRGVVQVEKSGKKRLYSTTERLYFVYKLRRDRNKILRLERNGTAAVNLIRFMNVFYRITGHDDEIEDGIATFDDIDLRTYTAMVWTRRAYFEWLMQWHKTIVLAQNDEIALDEFHSLYRAFSPDDRAMMSKMVRGVSKLIAAGLSADDIANVMATDFDKSEALLPLTIALRQLAGETVRAPIEVIEVAMDVREYLGEGQWHGDYIQHSTPTTEDEQ